MIIGSLVLFFFCLLGVIQLLHGEYDDKEGGTEDISKQAIRLVPGVISPRKAEQKTMARDSDRSKSRRGRC